MPIHLKPALAAAIIALTPLTTPLLSSAAQARQVQLTGDGLIKVRSAYSLNETVERLKKDIAAKGIMFFQEIDQSKLAADAGVVLRPSTLLLFGNPPLGTQFLTANPYSGIDWPVRLLVSQDSQGTVWATYTDFGWIAKRHGIGNRQKQFAMASDVIASITSAIKANP